MIENGERVASREDALVSGLIAAFLQEEGVALYTQSALDTVVCEPNALHCQIKNTQGHRSVLDASHLLLATGRLPNTQFLGLESVGVVVDARGFVDVNSQLETTVPGLWALGDMNKRGAFTHTSYHDYEIVRDNLRSSGTPRSADERVICYAMFTDPPLGRVGLNMAAAKQEQEKTGRQFLVATHLMKHVSRAKEESETHGVIQFIVDALTEQFVGATVLGIQGDEIIQVISNYMSTGASYRLMRNTLPVHPTVTEYFPTILDKLKPL